MKIPSDAQIPSNIRSSKKKTRFYVDNEILEKYGQILKPQGIAIYCALARHANSKTQACFPSYPRIMKMAGVGKRNTISKYLKILEKEGLVLVDRNKKRVSNIYWLLKIDSHSIQMGTSDREISVQKGEGQYTKGNVHSTERDTLNQRIESDKETLNLSEKNETGFQRSMREYVPPWKI